MSEYWVSTKRYFCKYCEIYIADDVPSRQQHENGLRHKGNRERFIRGIYKTGEKKKKDLEEEKREMAKIEQAAQAAYHADIGAGHSTHSSASAPVASGSKSVANKLPIKPSNPWTNYSTAQSLGYTDPDIGRQSAEAERHRTQGVAGEWQLVTPSMPNPAADPSPDEPIDVAETGVKRPAETSIDDMDTREYKIGKKRSVGLGDIYDPGVIPIKVKKYELNSRPAAPPTQPSTSATSTSAPQLADGKLKWTKVEWKKANEGLSEVVPPVKKEEDTPPASSTSVSPWVPVQDSSEDVSVKTEDAVAVGLAVAGKDEPANVKLEEDAPSEAKVSASISVKRESTEPPTSVPSKGSLFRKRTTPAGLRAGKRLS
ncbi:hypothetical protein FISHEDRAFT_67565 [Fistulina hepatica ATCC 64428]|uniref:Matrin-type domain-containing protein n=1 Tax=Fistulina hepatica ATCC 64428 TaxID=1128425 RepID=A0A0D7A276_9AGAR|nr:hypothetical protein FISHEDRAFT_67565 [Fistulina hepatica ATCC 64428]